MQYTKTHEWIKKTGDDNHALIGITDHAQNALSDVVFVELPEIGKTFNAGESLLAIESVKAASDIYAPVSGKVVAVNEALEEKPELVNQSPEADGWMIKIELAKPEELTGLLDQAGYQAVLKELE